jgi:hypothetical protein
MSFPLYDILFDLSTSNSDLTLTQKDTIIKFIKELDLAGQKNIFLILKIYSLKSLDSSIFDIPYKGIKTDKEQYMFDIDNFPVRLKFMLLKFCEIHMESQKRKI